MGREKLLEKKVDVLTKQLDAWAIKRKILRPGERLSFSLKVEKDPVPGVSSYCLIRFGGRFIKAAELTEQEVEEILKRVARFKRGGKQMTELLVTKKNKPSRIYHPQPIQRALQAAVNGKHYRLAAKDGLFQLWEIEPAPA